MEIRLAMSTSGTSALTKKSMRGRRPFWVGACALIVALALYLSTLLTHVPINPDENLVDVGEMQIALNLWGTLHHTGYPLYTILGSAFTGLYRALGGSPAAGPSVFSVLWAVGALGLAYTLLLSISRHGACSTMEGAQPCAQDSSQSSEAATAPSRSATHADLASAIGALYIAVTSAFWINASIPEVYSMYMALIVAALLVARRLAQRWSDGGFVCLAAVLGVAGAHHRLAVFALPAVAIYIAPNLWRNRRKAWWLVPVAALAGLVGFLPYLYLPLRAAQGARWVFGSPGTWEGFWRIFIGPGRVISGPRTVAAVVPGPLRIARTLLGEAHPLGILVGTAGLVGMVASRRYRQDGLALLSIVPAYLAAAVLFPIAAVGENFLMVIIVALGAGIATAISWLGRRGRGWGMVSLAVGSALVALLASHNYVTIRAITSAVEESALVGDINGVPRVPGEAEPAFMLPWGRHYFAAYFARYVSGEIEALAVVDHNTDFAADLASGRPLYTLPLTFGRFPLSWWERRLGAIHLAAAAPGVVEISDEPIIGVDDLSDEEAVPLGDGIILLDASVEPRSDGQPLVFVLDFRATRAVSADYSVSVRISDRETIASREDILAQQDWEHPVFGCYPTSLWRPGEVVRDIYAVQVPEDGRPRRAELLFYERLANGEFRNLRPVAISLPANDS
jgi:hypothetical protein